MGRSVPAVGAELLPQSEERRGDMARAGGSQGRVRRARRRGEGGRPSRGRRAAFRSRDEAGTPADPDADPRAREGTGRRPDDPRRRLRLRRRRLRGRARRPRRGDRPDTRADDDHGRARTVAIITIDEELVHGAGAAAPRGGGPFHRRARGQGSRRRCLPRSPPRARRGRQGEVGQVERQARDRPALQTSRHASTAPERLRKVHQASRG